MTPDQIDVFEDAIATVGTAIDLAVLYVAVAAGLCATAALLVFAAGYWTFHCLAWASRQPGIRRVEAFANHPAHRSRRNQQRKETDQP